MYECLSLDCMVNEGLQDTIYTSIAGGLFPVVFFILVIMFLRMR